MAVGVAIALAWVLQPSAARTLGVTHTYATTASEEATFTLSDGTQVTLSPKTTLRLEQFGENSRTVTLNGEAYFHVARATRTPFLVRVGSGTIRVLGTAFLTRYDPTTARTWVAVADGKVVVTPRTARSPNVVLTAGRNVAMIASDSVNDTNVVSGVSPATNWSDGQFIFRDVPLSVVLHALSQWYGYQFRLTDSTMTEQPIKIVVSMRSSAAALATLEKILDAHLTVSGDTITVNPGHSRASKGTPRMQVYDSWTPKGEIGR